MTPSTAPHTAHCDREPIRTPGAIQPHGILLVIDARTARVEQLAGDVRGAFGVPADKVLGRSLDRLLDRLGAARLRRDWTTLPATPGFLGSWSAPAQPGTCWDVTGHRLGRRVVIEIEPGARPWRSAAEGMASLCTAINAIEMPAPVEAMHLRAARAMRRLTGFDRVMVYRFLEDGSGEVLAEDRDRALPSLLHHRFPASDIPEQARDLYLRNRFRIIPDARYTPAPLVPARHAAGGPPLDMSDCVLRSVSPVHLAYLHNMRVAASMSVSIVVHGRLWGLVACHHASPRFLPYDIREACRRLGQSLSQQIAIREDDEHHRQTARLARAREKVLDGVRRDLATGAAVAVTPEAVREIVPCDGVVVATGATLQRCGRTPPPALLHPLLDWLRSPGAAPAGLFATHSLSGQYPPAEHFADTGSGLLAVLSGGTDGVALLWFRGEQVATVDWAGNPHKVAAGNPEAPSPRASFERWRETVRRAARPWSSAEMDAARRLGRALGELRQQQTLQELNERLRHALTEQESLVAQKNLLMQEVHHRVQNSLQIVNSMLQLQSRQASERVVREQFDAAVGRLMAISAVHQHLWRSSDMQHVRFGPYLRQLCDELLASWGEGWDGQISVDAHDATVSSNVAVTLALMVTELLTNAVKYAYDGAPGPVAVTIRRHDGDQLRISVADRGRGLGPDVAGSGLGSKLIRTFCRQLGGRMETESGAGGTRVTVSVPLAGALLPATTGHPDAG